MIWLVEKIARFHFHEAFANELPLTLIMSEDARVTQWDEHKLRCVGTHATLRNKQSAFATHLDRQLDLQRVCITLDPHPIDGDRSTASIWAALGSFLVQLPLEESLPRQDFLRMHFDKVRRWYVILQTFHANCLG
jgi:hypothetical protein